MNQKLVAAEVTPLYGQVSIEDLGSADVPDWETGDERAVASAQTVLVATRSDADGPVRLDVQRGSDDVGLGQEVFTGELTITSGTLECGSSLAGHVERLSLGGPRNVRLRIFVDPPDLPSRVTVLLAPDSA